MASRSEPLPRVAFGARLHGLRPVLTDPRGGVLALVLGAVFLARTDTAGILGALAWLPALGVWAGGRTALVKGVRAVRYLVLLAIVLHGWGGGGEPLWPAAGALSPRVEGLAAGLRQAAVLVWLAVAARGVLLASPAGRALAGLQALLAPLRIAGVAPGRVALRLWLTMEAAQALAAGPRTALAQTYRRAAAPAPADVTVPALPVLGAWWHALAAPALTAFGLGVAAALVRAAAVA